MPYLRLENITKQFGAFIANDNINLSIEFGTIHAILGENGAGKTNVLEALSLLAPGRGLVAGLARQRQARARLLGDLAGRRR